MSKTTTHLGVSVTLTVINQIDAIVQKTGWPKSKVVNKLLEERLDEINGELGVKGWFERIDDRATRQSALLNALAARLLGGKDSAEFKEVLRDAGQIYDRAKARTKTPETEEVQ